MKDFFGRDLQIGDIVACEEKHYRNLILAEVIRFTPQKVVVRYNSVEYITLPNHVIKRDQ